MARKAKVSQAKAGVVSDFKDAKVTLVNVLRIPRVEGTGEGWKEWLKSNRGSLLLDTLCFPVTCSVAVKTRHKTDHTKWVVTIDGADADLKTARDLAIGFGSLKDTTTNLEYMLKDREGMDAIPQDVKKTIIRRCKRVTTIKRLNVVCRLVDSLHQMQGIGDCFTDAEKIELFNKPASLLNAFRDALNKVQATKEKKSYFSLA